MNEILNVSIENIPGISFDCSCGRKHTFPMEFLSFGKGVLPDIAKAVKPYMGEKIFLFTGANSDLVAGRRVRKILLDAGCDVQYYVFPADEGHDLFPDETSLGRMLINMRRGTGLLVGVGSGVINDLGKYASMLTGIPHMIVATAPSMDGYLSSSSSMTCENKKLSVPTVLPVAAVGDTEILQDAPFDMIQAGFGDMLGKLTALADWKLAEIQANEYYCDTTAQLVQRSVSELLASAEALAVRDEAAVDLLIQGLILCGVAMSLVGQSRPASGAEHMLSHYWEMEFHRKNMPVHFHGTKVGIATLLVARIFEKMADILPDEVLRLAPSSEACREYLKEMALPLSPAAIGVDRELFVRSLKEAYQVRNRYSILRYARDTGRIDTIAEELAAEYYEGASSI